MPVAREKQGLRDSSTCQVERTGVGSREPKGHWLDAVDLLLRKNGGMEKMEKRCQVPFPGRPRLRRVFSNPNCATAPDTDSFEPHGQLRLCEEKVPEDKGT
jgi:hypothetical protein